MSQDNLGGGIIPTLSSLLGGPAASTQKAHSPAELSGPNGHGHLACESPSLSSYFYKRFIYFWLCWVFVAVCGFSLLWRVGARLHSAAWLYCCGGFFCWGAPALGTLVSVVVACGLSCSTAWGLFPTRDQPHVRCIGRGILNHWSTREAPPSLLRPSPTSSWEAVAKKSAGETYTHTQGLDSERPGFESQLRHLPACNLKQATSWLYTTIPSLRVAVGKRCTGGAPWMFIPVLSLFSQLPWLLAEAWLTPEPCARHSTWHKVGPQGSCGLVSH